MQLYVINAVICDSIDSHSQILVGNLKLNLTPDNIVICHLHTLLKHRVVTVNILPSFELIDFQYTRQYAAQKKHKSTSVSPSNASTFCDVLFLQQIWIEIRCQNQID